MSYLVRGCEAVEGPFSIDRNTFCKGIKGRYNDRTEHTRCSPRIMAVWITLPAGTEVGQSRQNHGKERLAAQTPEGPAERGITRPRSHIFTALNEFRQWMGLVEVDDEEQVRVAQFLGVQKYAESVGGGCNALLGICASDVRHTCMHSQSTRSRTLLDKMLFNIGLGRMAELYY